MRTVWIPIAAALLGGCYVEDDLPEGWEDAQLVEDLDQSDCEDGDPYEGPPPTLSSPLGSTPLEVGVEHAVFRCDQAVQGFWKKDGDTYDVLVQPEKMNPRKVAKCDCAYVLDIDVTNTDAPPTSVTVFLRKDNLNDDNDPVLVGTVDGTPCEAVAPETCAARADCAAIAGRAMHDDGVGGWCVDFADPSVPVGCMDANTGCTDAEVLALPPDDPTWWWFPSGCLPQGWLEVGSIAPECPT